MYVPSCGSTCTVANYIIDLVTVEHSAHTATVFVDYRSATTAKSLFTEKIPMTSAYSYHDRC